MTDFDREPNYEQYRYEAYILEDISGPDRFPEFPKPDYLSEEADKWDNYTVAALRNEAGDTVITPFSTMGANLHASVSLTLDRLKRKPEAFGKQIAFIESIEYRWKEDQDESDGNTYYSLSLLESAAEDEAFRELTEDEQKELQKLVDNDREITRHQTQIIRRFKSLVRQALDEDPVEIENRIESQSNG